MRAETSSPGPGVGADHAGLQEIADMDLDDTEVSAAFRNDDE